MLILKISNYYNVIQISYTQFPLPVGFPLLEVPDLFFFLSFRCSDPSLARSPPFDGRAEKTAGELVDVLGTPFKPEVSLYFNDSIGVLSLCCRTDVEVVVVTSLANFWFALLMVGVGSDVATETSL